MTDLIVGDAMPCVQYLADGTQTDFTFPFPVLAAGDLVVLAEDGTSPGSYSVTGLGQSAGGNVTFAAPPASGVRLTLYRNMPVARTTDFVEAGDFRASALNAELDRLAMMIQQIEAASGRAVRRAPEDVADDLTLPPKAERADSLLGFDAQGLPAPLTAPKAAAVDAAASAANASDAAETASTAATTATDAASQASASATSASADAASANTDATTADDAALRAETAAANAVAASSLPEERRRNDLALQRLSLGLAHPAVMPPVWAVDGVHGLGLDFLSVSRPGPATHVNARGQRVTVGTDIPRLDHDPATGEPLGLLIESARTNLLHDSFNPTSQTRTLAAGTYTVSLAGSGQVDLTGAATGTATMGSPLTVTLGGSGDVTFTPSGTVTVFQCEAGGDATSFIETPVDGSATRPADNVTALDLEWFAPDHATILFEMAYPDVPTDDGSRLFSLDDGGDGNRHNIYWAEWAQKLSWYTKSAGVGQGSVSGLQGGWGGDGARHVIGLRLGGGVRDLFIDGTQAVSGTVTEPVGLTTLRLGGYHVDQQQARAHIRRVLVWNAHLSDADLMAVTS